tara:strand:+ start:180 stop:374 length:195 start_codon:yes stop_codon:yes gene_type:complete
MSGLSDFLIEFCELLGEKYNDKQIKGMDIEEMIDLMYLEKERQREEMLEKLAEENGFKKIEIKK